MTVAYTCPKCGSFCKIYRSASNVLMLHQIPNICQYVLLYG